MATSISALTITAALNRRGRQWDPPEAFGPDGWSWTHRSGRRSCIVTCADADDGTEWLHASITGDGQVPDYEALKELHAAVWGSTGWAYQAFAPAAEHIDIHAHALHLWGRLDGRPALPDFTLGARTI